MKQVCQPITKINYPIYFRFRSFNLSIFFFRIAEDTILALANVSRQLNDRGKMKEADKVLDFARFQIIIAQFLLKYIDLR